MKEKLQEKKKWLHGWIATWLDGQMVKWLVGGLVALIVLVFGAYHLAYWERIYPGMKVVNQPVGNLTVAEATAVIQHFASLPANQATPGATLTLVHEEQQWELDLTEIGFAYQPSKTAQKAYRIGRSGAWQKDLTTKLQGWFEGLNLEMEYDLDQALLKTKVNQIAQQIFIPAVEPAIKVADGQVAVEQSQEGQELDKQKLLSTINNQLSAINFNPLSLPLVRTTPLLTEEQIENTRQRAYSFLGKRLILADEEKHWQLEEEELIQFLSFTNGFDQDKIASWSAQLAVTINRPPENATFQFAEGRVVEFKPAREGRTLAQEKTIDLIAQSLAQLETLPAPAPDSAGQASEKEMTVRLPVITTAPAIKTADVNNLGIKQLVGRGVSYFRGSITSRIHNIQLASSKLNGLLILPDETFAFNQTLGEVSPATGFKEAYIIKEGRTVLGDGGGVCQVSTTLFRAALNAGLPIVERHPHAYRVSYYEQNSPVGLDATVFDPTADLKFKNDTPAYLLIQAKTDTKNKILTFELYGTPDDRTVTISKSRIWDQTPPPPDLYQDDPTLPAGTIKQIDWKAWGAKVAFDYQVERNGEVLQDRTFYSVYRPWQAVFLRGTGSFQ